MGGRSTKVIWGAGWLWLVLAGCTGGAEGPREGEKPLRPLIYTEFPELSPEGAAVREERLIRNLVEGSEESVEGVDRLERIEPLPLLDEAEELGAAVVEALLMRDEELWEHSFISAQAYGQLVHLRRQEAEEFVDNQIGGSLPVWRLFGQTSSSEMAEGGLGALFSYDGMELGRGRTVGGGVARGGEEAVQFWGNRIFLRHRESGVRFELRVARIFRVWEGEESEGEEAGRTERPGEAVRVYKVASEIEADRSFLTFLGAGLHLKPELMRSWEYPFPLRVGNFWRYRRYDADQGDEEIDPLERILEEDPRGGPAAREVVLEVMQVSQYGAVRLVELRRSYDDHRFTRVSEWWALTPRQIYACSRECQEKIEDLGWLVHYFENQIPLLSFPLRLGRGWSHAGRESSSGTHRVDEEWHLVETPAGTFPATYAIEGRGALGWWDPFYQRSQVRRYFHPGRGLVRLEITERQGERESVNVVEELVEYRLTQ